MWNLTRDEFEIKLNAYYKARNDEIDLFNHLAFNTANLSGAASVGKLKDFGTYFPQRSTERAEKPALEDRIRDAWKLHKIRPPKGYEHLMD